MHHDLVIRARDGDRESFTLLATASFEQLFRTARLILRDEDRAADAVQEALLSAWLNIRTIRDPERFDAWLRRLLVRACYRDARRAGRRRVMEIQVASLETPVRDDFEGTSADRDRLERGFRRLTTDHRAVLVVHHYLDLSDVEAAVVLDIALGTFKSRLHRATAALRDSLDADDRSPIRVQESLA